jgi:hypothetical protein
MRHDWLLGVYREAVCALYRITGVLEFLPGVGVMASRKVLELDFLLYLYDDSITYIPRGFRGFRGMDGLFFGIEYQLEHPLEIEMNRTCNTICA